jgi:hypothetical protein
VRYEPLDSALASEMLGFPPGVRYQEAMMAALMGIDLTKTEQRPQTNGISEHHAQSMDIKELNRRIGWQ